MLLLLPILVPLIGGIFVFRQKNETYRDWLVVTLIVTGRSARSDWLTALCPPSGCGC